ncbi:MAG: nuclear transport factor 2 family protein [Chloroflexota bacterium]
MSGEQGSEEVRQAAMELDAALEERDTERVVACFSEDCEIELLGVRLAGCEGVRKWLGWFFHHVASIRFEPVIVLVQGSTFFKEFVAHATLWDGTEVDSRQAEVLLFEGVNVKSLRLYFDRLDFGRSFAGDPLRRALLRRLTKASLKGLE